ncbi:hypothetical protein HYH02_015032 [Chlamydomonas schloesseri]|uniref:Kazal-like domain-containing protein n=1 Tax=Chlamydomonas schloesseri TaxID=2026947 RepID=A0A835VU62_9CHLO|nr:hypothetical protein HYH02_015032 [Chlamydomonas schloesseri]|eukprot:KAG2425426.1 hypothetical protein HYH02_015032 [Chlamydomonas schloesseri]
MCNSAHAQGGVILGTSYSCPPGAEVTKCSKAACDPAVTRYPGCTAANTPGAAVCAIAPCAGGFLDNGYKVPVCSAIWRQLDGLLAICPLAVVATADPGGGTDGSGTAGGGRAEGAGDGTDAGGGGGGGDVTTPSRTNAVSCPGGATVACPLDPCSALPADCPWAAWAARLADATGGGRGGVTCESSNCTKGRLPDGSAIGPCTAVFRSAADKSVLGTCPTSPTPQQQPAEGGGDGGEGRGVKPTDGSASCNCRTCGIDGKTYSNGCEAECAKVKVVARGICFPNCPGGAGTAACPVDPCSSPAADGSKPSCKADPAATCLFSKCGQTLVLDDGTQVPPCQAVWLSASSGLPVKDCGVDPTTLLPEGGGDSTAAGGGSGGAAGTARTPATTSNVSSSGSEKTPAGAAVVACPAGAPVKPCPVNPCATQPASSCPFARTRGTHCTFSTCVLGQLPDGSTVLPCTPVYTLPDGQVATCSGGEEGGAQEGGEGRVLPADPVPPLDAPNLSVDCPGGATVACPLDPCSALPADCPWAAWAARLADATGGGRGGVTCESSNCTKGRLPDGSAIGPCTAVFRSAADKSVLGTCPTSPTAASSTSTAFTAASSASTTFTAATASTPQQQPKQGSGGDAAAPKSCAGLGGSASFG